MEIAAQGISEKGFNTDIAFSWIASLYVAMRERGIAIGINLVVSSAAISPENAICNQSVAMVIGDQASAAIVSRGIVIVYAVINNDTMPPVPECYAPPTIMGIIASYDVVSY